jgi:cytokinin dehydrogenase
MQTDNVLELEVVTGEGKIVTCSSSENSELFDCVRAGLGQFGIVTRATLALVPAPDRARKYTLVYPDLESMTADQRMLLANRRPDHLQGTILAVDGRWRYQLDMAICYPSGEPPDDDEVLSGLADDRRKAQIDDASYREYAESFDRFTELLHSTGEWSCPHPWWFTFLPGSTAEQVVRTTLRDITADDLGNHGLVTFYPRYLSMPASGRNTTARSGRGCNARRSDSIRRTHSPLAMSCSSGGHRGHRVRSTARLLPRRPPRGNEEGHS